MICSIISPCIILVISHEFPAAVFGAVTTAHAWAPCYPCHAMVETSYDDLLKTQLKQLHEVSPIALGLTGGWWMFQLVTASMKSRRVSNPRQDWSIINVYWPWDISWCLFFKQEFSLFFSLLHILGVLVGHSLVISLAKLWAWIESDRSCTLPNIGTNISKQFQT